MHTLSTHAAGRYCQHIFCKSTCLSWAVWPIKESHVKWQMQPAARLHHSQHPSCASPQQKRCTVSPEALATGHIQKAGVDTAPSTATSPARNSTSQLDSVAIRVVEIPLPHHNCCWGSGSGHQLQAQTLSPIQEAGVSNHLCSHLTRPQQ